MRRHASEFSDAIKTIELRAHTREIRPRGTGSKNTAYRNFPLKKWPKCALVLDCETSVDDRQFLTFGCYRYCRHGKEGYHTVQEGFFHEDDLDSGQPAILRQYGEAHGVEILSRSEFIKKVFWQAIRAEALIVGFNLSFDLSRLALESCWSERSEAWSLTMSQFRWRKTGKLYENGFRPRVIIKPKDGKGSFFRLTNPRWKREKDTTWPMLRPLDLKTLIWALTNKSHTLGSACKALGIPGKIQDHKPSGKVTVEEIAYNRHDGVATIGLLNALRLEFDRHPIPLVPDRAYSPASIAKAYLEEMGIKLPSEKFRLSQKIHGIAMQSYYGGRAECRIRRTSVPVVYLDFLSQYPTVNALMGLWSLLIAKKLKIKDATQGARNFLRRATLECSFNPKFWKHLLFFALVKPSKDILPVHTAYGGKSSSIGVNPLTSEKPVWFAGPDLVASRLLTGKTPKIIKAIRVVPEGKQDGLRPVRLRNAVEVDPVKEDFFKKVIEAREQIKDDTEMLGEERKTLAYFLKILANSEYGFFVELNSKRVKNKAKQNRERLRVFSGQKMFETSSPIVETPGLWYFPIFASLIASGGRLLLAMLERSVTDAKGSYAVCDTDSMAVVASENGGLVPCPGGQYRLPDGREAVKALSWADLRRRLSDKFVQLNPYDRHVVTDSVLKIEDVNFDAEEKQREIFCYAVSAKRYALFTKTAREIQIVKASGHSLGYLYDPKPGFDEEKEVPVWIVEAWNWIVRDALHLRNVKPKWFGSPAMMRIVIRTPEVLKVLQERQKRLPYRDRVKPFNFVFSPVVDKVRGYPTEADRGKFFPVAIASPVVPSPGSSNDWIFVNIHDGQSYLMKDPRCLANYSFEFIAETYGYLVARHAIHKEAKSLGPDGEPCAYRTAGLLERRPITAAGEFRFIGKETSRKWEAEEDISLFNWKRIEYLPEETKRMVYDPVAQNEIATMSISVRELSRRTGLSRNTIRRIREGKRTRKSTLLKIKFGTVEEDSRVIAANGMIQRDVYTRTKAKNSRSVKRETA